MWLNDFEFDVNLNSILTVFEATFSYHSIMVFFSNFRDLRVFPFGYTAQNENPEITENIYFWIYKAQMDVGLFLITILTF